MSGGPFSSPSGLIERLEAIEQDLAVRQNAYESAARSHYLAKRDREHQRAVAFIEASGTVAERSAYADRETSMVGRESEAEYEALKAVVRVLETRSTIGMALLKSQGRL